MNPTLRRFVIRESTPDRQVLMVTGSRKLDRPDTRPVVQSVLRERLSVLPPSTLYVSGGCEGSPDVWGHKIAYECGILDHLMFTIDGYWRHYHLGRVVYRGVWVEPSNPAGGPNRNYAMVDAVGLMRAYKAKVLALACQAKWSPLGGTGHTIKLVTEEKLPLVSARFYIENDEVKYDITEERIE